MFLHNLLNLILVFLSAELLQGEHNVLSAELAASVRVKAVEDGLQTWDTILPVEALGVDSGAKEVVVVDHLISIVVHLVDDCLQLSLALLVVLELFDGLAELLLADHAVPVLVNLLELLLQQIDLLTSHCLDDEIKRSLLQDGLSFERAEPLQCFLHLLSLLFGILFSEDQIFFQIGVFEALSGRESLLRIHL